MRVVLVSDTHFHVGARLPVDWIAKVNALEPDLILLAGDLIDDDSGVDPCGEAFGRLRAKTGIFAVLGNHDHRHYRLVDFLLARRVALVRNDIDRLVSRLAEEGIDVLRNEARELDVAGVRVDLLGFGDAVTGEFDRERTFEHHSPPEAHGVRIFLSHWGEPTRASVADRRTLGVSGHTHGGQVWIPFVSRALLGRRLQSDHFRGWSAVPGGGRLYVGRGLGAGRLVPFRLNAIPEIAVFDIQADVAPANRDALHATADMPVETSS